MAQRSFGKNFVPTGGILVCGLDGNDTIVSKKIKKRAFIDGGEGNDTLTGLGGNDILLVGAGADRLVKSAGKNLRSAKLQGVNSATRPPGPNDTVHLPGRLQGT